MTTRGKLFRAYLVELIEEEGLDGDDPEKDAARFFAGVIADLESLTTELASDELSMLDEVGH